MALTTGQVQKLTYTDTVVCAQVGPVPDNTELLFISFKSSDSEQALGFKRALAYLLAQAQASGYRVQIQHPDNSGEITSIASDVFDICPVGPAIHNDFYAISGSGIPDDVQVVFESTSTTVTVTPDLVRPQLVFIAQLPAAIAPGRVTVQLQASGWSSDAVPTEVTAGPQTTVRTLYAGAPRSRPYTVAFVANPAIEAAAGGSFSVDPVLTDRIGYQEAVSYCLDNLLTVTEDLLRQGNIDAEIRFVSIFDAHLGATDSNSLAHEFDPNLMETRRDRLNAFLSRYGEQADIVFVIHGSSTHTRATAWYTTDDNGDVGTPYTYDNTSRTHRHFPSIPGSAAVPITVNTTGLTALHEYGHAASDFNNGRVNDLYHDGAPSGFVVNKKRRSSTNNPIPHEFATYNGITYLSDQNRDSIGYDNSWSSYHPELIDSSRPNMMDNYWLAFDNPLRCRVDRLTFNWLSARLRAKIFR